MSRHQPHSLRRTETVRHLNQIVSLQETCYDIQLIIRESFERIQGSQTVGYSVSPQLVKSISVASQILRRHVPLERRDRCFFACNLSRHQTSVYARSGKRYDLACSVTA